ncbi:MAG: hypothetical protein JKY48_03845 [Flavobacteriales bacterium]|nr:hypothetical protein [Flavobacteriales bacterium]
MSRILSVNYGWFTIGSIVIYGFIAVQVATITSSFNGVLAGCFLGLFDTIVGALIAKKIKPNIGDMEGFSWELTPGIVGTVVLFGGFISMLAIWLFL